MATIITGSGDLMETILGGNDNRNPQIQQYFMNNINNAQQWLGNTTTALLDRAKSAYNRYFSEDALDKASRAIRKLHSIDDSISRNNIIEINTLSGFQNASILMQRWIMANPVVREKYRKQTITGYADTYEDMYPDDTDYENYDYRRVMNGIVVENDDGWGYSYYIDDLLPGDRELTFDEQVDIRCTWKCIENILKQKKLDPTDPLGEAEL